MLRKVRAHQRLLEREIERGKATFDEVVAQRARPARGGSRAHARARCAPTRCPSSQRRSGASPRSGAATSPSASATRPQRLGEQLVQAQAAVEQRLGDWQSDVAKLQEGLAEELKRVEAKQRQLMAEVESKIGQDAEGLQARDRGAARS